MSTLQPPASTMGTRDRSPSPSRKHKSRDRRDTDKDRSRSRSRSPHSKHHSSHRSSKHYDRDRDDEDRHRKHRRNTDRDETEEERKERKRLKKEKKHGERDQGLDVVDDDPSMWVEKSIDGAASPSHLHQRPGHPLTSAAKQDATSSIPTSGSLPLRSNPSGATSTLPPASTANTETQRDSWMLEPPAGSASTVPAATRDIPKSAGAGVYSTSSTGMTEGYGDEQASNRTMGGGVDFFSSMGTEHKKKDPKADMPDPSKLVIDKRFELNTQLIEGKAIDDYETKEKKIVFGGPGHQWRMMKLKRLHEQAEEQDRDIREVALERYGSLDEFNEALDERRFLDDRDARRKNRRPGPGGSDGYASTHASTPGGGGSSGMRTPDTSGRRFMFANPGEDAAFGSSRPGSRGGFRRPGEEREVGTPSGGGGGGGGRVEDLRRGAGVGGAGAGLVGTPGMRSAPGGGKVSTPIPSVFTPTALTRSSSHPSSDSPANPNAGPGPGPTARDPTSSQPPLTTEQLNKLQARVLRARLTDDPTAQALEDEYELERYRSEEAAAGRGGLWEGGAGGVQGQMGRLDEEGREVKVQVLPTLDGRGQLYDVGTGKQDEAPVLPGNRSKKPPATFETRDKEGNLLRYNADDDEQSLGELVRQEKFGAGSADQKNLDAEMARAIATDGKFQDDTDYMDDNAEKLARRKMKSDAMKRAFAINDYARTKKALDSCPFCYQDDLPPQTAIVALGTRTYMCCTQTEELVPGHCLIVPLQHQMSMLEMEDDDWDEVRNFMKCLMRMHAQQNNGVIFFETILSFKSQKHTYIEAVPVPFTTFQDLPAYFRESILSSEGEWTQHKKLIDFSTRPGGIRRMMVPKLPYFMVQWDYKGEKGYGHVIEGVADSGAGGGTAEEEGDVGGTSVENEFPRYFAHEVIGNVLGLEPRKWRKPRRMDVALNKERARKLGTQFQPFNWTVGQGV